MSPLSLIDLLSTKFQRKRKEHPSFRLIEIDDSLFPNGIITFETEAKDSDDRLRKVKDIIAESWKRVEKNHLMIQGEGGIGKTVTLLSIPDKLAPYSVPAIYIPLYELTGDTNSIEKYIKSILNNKANLYDQLLELLDMDWDKGPQVLLLLDGFNEIASENRESIRQDIERWSEYAGIQIITSSRYDIHGYVSVSYSNSVIKLQLLPEGTIENFLKNNNLQYPDNDAIKKFIRIPLFLVLYVKTELILKLRKTESSDFKESKNAGTIVWNYLQCELWKFGKEDNNAKAAIITMEFIAPYMAWKMQQQSLFNLNVKKSETSPSTIDARRKKESFTFLDAVEEAYTEFTKQYAKVPNNFPLFHIQEALQKSNGIPEINLIRNLLEKHLCLFVKNGDVYQLMHQQFRDALAAIHLINSIYLNGNNRPTEWNSTIDHYVMQFVADLISEDEANRLWEQNRTNLQLEEATRNQLELQKRLRNNDFSELNFSGLDLSNISLFPYQVPNTTTLRLPHYADKMTGTMFSERTFSAEGHLNSICAVTVTPDGKRIISGSRDKTIRIWDLESGAPIGKPIEGHSNYVTAVAVTPDGKRIISGSYDNTIRVWDLETGTQIGKTIEGHRCVVSSVVITPDGKHIISGSWDNTIRVWDLHYGLPIGNPIIGHKFSVYAVAVTPDGKYVISGSGDKTIRIWDLKTGNQLGEPIEEHLNTVSTVAVTSDGKYIVSGSWDNTIRVWSYSTRKLIREIKGHSNSIDTIAITQDSKYIISGSADKTIRIWDLETGSQHGKLIEGHDDSVNTLVITPDGKRIISGSSDKTIRVWDLETRDQIGMPIVRQSNSIYAVAVTPDGKYFASLSWDNTIRIWDLMNGDPIGKPILRHNMSKYSDAVALTSDGNYLIGKTLDNTIQVWNLKTGTLLLERAVEEHENLNHALSKLLNVKCFDCVHSDKFVKPWQLELVDDVTTTLNGKRIVSGADDGTIRISEIGTSIIIKIQLLPLLVTGIDFSKANFSTGELKEQLLQNGAIV
jgi:WD40 repeat protein